MTSTEFFTPVIWAGPETEPHSSNEDVTDVIVIEAKGEFVVVGTERSTTHPEIFEREQGVLAFGAEDGRIRCALD